MWKMVRKWSWVLEWVDDKKPLKAKGRVKRARKNT